MSEIKKLTRYNITESSGEIGEPVYETRDEFIASVMLARVNHPRYDPNAEYADPGDWWDNQLLPKDSGSS